MSGQSPNTQRAEKFFLRAIDKRGWLLLWGVLSAMLMFGSLGPWLNLGLLAGGRLTDAGGQRGHGWLVLLAAVVGAVLLIVWRQRRIAGVAAFLAGLVGLGVTLHAATHLNGLVGGRLGGVHGFGPVGWGLRLALFASLSLALCGLVWLQAIVDPDRGHTTANAIRSDGSAEPR